MKKQYNKPEIEVENFLLTESISTCDDKVTFSTSSGCANNADWVDHIKGAFSYFTSDDNCTITNIGSDVEYNGSCYFTSHGRTVFSS